MNYIALLDIIEDCLGRESRRGEKITLRGYDLEKASPPAELHGITLPVNLIVNDYCPSGRDLYLLKVKEIKPVLTFSSFKGRVIHDVYYEVFKLIQEITRNVKLKNLDLDHSIMDWCGSFIENVSKILEKEKGKMFVEPSSTEIDAFLQDIYKIIRFEGNIIGTLVDFKISKKYDIRIASEIEILFPFILNPKISAPQLGFSGAVEPDFIYKNQVMGDIKTGRWQEFFKLSSAAYALAFECENNTNIDYGTILNVELKDDRKVPIYRNTQIEVINDALRYAVLQLRDEKFQMIHEEKDPGIKSCKQGCGFYDVCHKGGS